MYLNEGTKLNTHYYKYFLLYKYIYRGIRETGFKTTYILFTVSAMQIVFPN